MKTPPNIDCEGSGCPTHDADPMDGMCAMCGRYVPVDRNACAVPHQRPDVLAAIAAHFNDLL